MDRNSIYSVINALLNEDVGEPKVKKTSDEANNNGRPRFHESTSSGNTDEAAETAIHGEVEVECRLSSLAFGVYEVGKKGGDSSRCSGQGGVDTSKGGCLRSSRGSNTSGGTDIEAIPAEP